MPRRKSRQLSELSSLPNVICEEAIRTRGRFRDCFEVERPLILDVGCGKGEHAIELARRRPDHNVVGVDLKGARLHAAASQAIAEGVSNIAFLKIEWRRIPSLITQPETEEAWLLFPDPHPKQREAHRRLTSKKNLGVFQHLLKPWARIHLRTDSRSLLEYTEAQVRGIGGRILSQRFEIARNLPAEDDMSIHTTYEKRFREEGRVIDYLCFALPEPSSALVASAS